jgi:hypothetical protein
MQQGTSQGASSAGAADNASTPDTETTASKRKNKHEQYTKMKQ